MHLQNTLFDLNLGVKVTQNNALYPLHHVTYGTAKLKVTMSNDLRYNYKKCDGQTHRRKDQLLTYHIFLKTTVIKHVKQTFQA